MEKLFCSTHTTIAKLSRICQERRRRFEIGIPSTQSGQMAMGVSGYIYIIPDIGAKTPTF